MKGSKKHTVLLVDDSATNNLLLQVVFDQNGFNVETASSGKDAIKILAKKHIDVVLLDLMMPQMSGFEVLTAIKGNPETAKIPARTRRMPMARQRLSRSIFPAGSPLML